LRLVSAADYVMMEERLEAREARTHDRIET